jgi:hypothetical protein
MQFVPASVEITGKHIVPFAVYRQCSNIPAAITYDDQPGGNARREHTVTQGALRFSLQKHDCPDPWRRQDVFYDANSSNNAFASFRSSVSNPSVNQP